MGIGADQIKNRDKERNKEERSRAYAQLAMRFTSTGIILERGRERRHDSWKEVTSRRGEERKTRKRRNRKQNNGAWKTKGSMFSTLI